MVEIIKKYKSSKYKGLMVDLDDTLITSNQVYDKAMKYTSSFVAQKFGLDKEQNYCICSFFLTTAKLQRLLFDGIDFSYVFW